MKIGTKLRGLQIGFRNGVISVAWWKPIKDTEISEQDRQRLKLTGTISNSKRVCGGVELVTRVGPAEQ